MKTYLERLLENSEHASKQWSEFSNQIDDAADFKKRFHLRPTSRKVTIVSTLPEKPMRGKRVGKTVVKKWLAEIYKIMDADITNENKIKMLTELGFQDRRRGLQRKKEESLQARMIAQMSENKSLKEFLQVEELLFVASEFIIHDQQDSSARERIDVIAYDGNERLFFFELKTPDSSDDPVAQVRRYLKRYGVEKREAMLKLLKGYPGQPVEKDNLKIAGYAVYGYGARVDTEESIKIAGGDQIGVIKFI